MFCPLHFFYLFIYLFIYLFWDFSSKGDCFLGSFWRIVLAKLEVNCWFKMFLCIQLECVKQNPVSFISYYTVVTPNFALQKFGFGRGNCAFSQNFLTRKLRETWYFLHCMYIWGHSLAFIKFCMHLQGRFCETDIQYNKNDTFSKKMPRLTERTKKKQGLFTFSIILDYAYSVVINI